MGSEPRWRKEEAGLGQDEGATCCVNAAVRSGSRTHPWVFERIACGPTTAHAQTKDNSALCSPGLGV
ncbi:hypothetical protein EYF80_050174 [Liparis tanakae]|uniref:Uncharacterized protein n=1 Tax=Liparis tanakae TaxID=230148 RepID=A0A4Z2FFF4_9TELE|nr:hypothetical protein EYF80_050174 [Liparis tanakae]